MKHYSGSTKSHNETLQLPQAGNNFSPLNFGRSVGVSVVRLGFYFAVSLHPGIDTVTEKPNQKTHGVKILYGGKRATVQFLGVNRVSTGTSKYGREGATRKNTYPAISQDFPEKVLNVSRSQASCPGWSRETRSMDSCAITSNSPLHTPRK